MRLLNFWLLLALLLVVESRAQASSWFAPDGTEWSVLVEKYANCVSEKDGAGNPKYNSVTSGNDVIRSVTCKKLPEQHWNSNHTSYVQFDVGMEVKSGAVTDSDAVQACKKLGMELPTYTDLQNRLMRFFPHTKRFLADTTFNGVEPSRLKSYMSYSNDLTPEGYSQLLKVMPSLREQTLWVANGADPQTGTKVIFINEIYSSDFKADKTAQGSILYTGFASDVSSALHTVLCKKAADL